MVADERILEIEGTNVEQAIEAGLARLNVNRDEVEVEILDEGSAGFLGIGGREAQVRLTVKVAEASSAESTEQTIVVDDIAAGEGEEIRGSTPSPGVALTEEIAEPEYDGPPEEEVAMDIVSTLLEMMQIEADISLHQTEPDDLTGERRWIVDVRGRDMGVLIGPRGETLNSVQYIARLMAGHSIRRRPNFIVDVEGYRERREQALAKLAERMANKVVSRGHPMSLEPMPPNERRIIHITLREDDRVYTESFGEGRHRKVKIFPKN